MAETPRLDLPYIAASQYQKEVVHNQSLDRLDLLCQCAVLDRNLTAPPASPALGDAYIVGSSPTGAWAGHANELALWVSSQWQLIAPLPGFQCWVIDEAVQVYWNGTAWTLVGTGGGGATTFLALLDTPDSYAGQSGKAVLVNAGGTALEFGTTGGGAPPDATYITATSNAILSAERVLTDSTQVAWNLATAGQVIATIPAHGVQLTNLVEVNPGVLLGNGSTIVAEVRPITIGSGLILSGDMLSSTGGGGGSSTFLALSDTPDNYIGYAGKTVLVNAGETALEFGTAPAGTFLALSDTPDVYTGQGGKVVAVKSDGSGLEFVTSDGGGAAGTGEGAKVVRTANQSIPQITLTPVQFDAEYFDQAAYWNVGAPTRITIAATGWYTVHARIQWVTGGSGIRDINVRLNNTTYLLIDRTAGGGLADANQMLAGVLYLTAGDYLEVVLYQNATGALNITGDLSIMRSGGSAAGSASSFLALSDTPDTYSGQASKIVQVNAGATATEFGPVLGTMAQQDANAVAITGGTATGLSQVTVTTDAANAALYTNRNAGGGRFGVQSQGTAPSYFGGTVQVVDAIGAGRTPFSGVRLWVGYAKTSNYGIILSPTDQDTGNPPIEFRNLAGSTIGSISTTATATAYNTSSDVRLKHAIAPLTAALERVRALRPVSFRWVADSSPGEGFLAHELMQHVPLAVSGLPDEVNDDGSIRPQQVDHSKLIVHLVGAVQELAAQLLPLQAQVQALTASIHSLEEQLGI